ncbi:MAG: DNA polymerase III subunit delta' [Ruminococcaceae bacterium]|nr:DNA polymerase III subunit delta' [Oscillospiraceae bacterium]
MISEKNKLPAERIREAAARGALSHAWLITGSGDRLELARYAAAAMECEAETGKPCGVCRACRKVFADIHPDVVTVVDPEHKNIAVDIVREVRADAYIRPNEGRRKVYIFPDCAILPEQGQNVLLKVVEEGPPYAAFLFCAENSAVVLQTLRSRCVELKLQGGEAAAEVLSGDADALCRAVASRRKGSVAELLTALERKKPERAAIAELLGRCHAAFSAALLLLYGQQPAFADREIAPVLAKTLTKTQIVSTIEVLQKYHGECGYNVGVGHVLGALAAELEGIL